MNNKILLVNMSQVEIPVIKETSGKDWIQFGNDNLFPQKLIDYSNKSALHNAILQSKTEQAFGLGLGYEGDENQLTEDFINKANPTESLNEVALKAIRDYNIHGGFALNIVWGKGFSKIAEIYHVDISKIRAGKPDERGNPEVYYYCSDWKNHRKVEVKPIAAFDPSNKKEASQLYYYKPYQPGYSVYPLPMYIGALTYIEVDIEVANLHLSNLKNGMLPSLMVNFTNGEPTEDEQKAIEKKIKDKFAGTDNAGKFILTFSQDKDHSPEINPISTNDIDKQYIQLNNMVLQNILSGHRITSPLLVGIKTEGQLGGNNELLTAYQIHTETVIEPIREAILGVINKLGTINGIQELMIIPNDPVEFSFGEDTLSQILSKNELRTKIGYEEIPTEQEQKERLIEVLGVGGTQALQAIISDPNMTEAVKKGLLSVVFGLSKEEIESIFNPII